MPVHPYMNAFTTGEVTEQLIARQDWAKYQHAAACLRNFVVRPHGGAARRAGLLFIGQAKFPDRRVRLKKFEFSITQAYVVEFGHLYARFWANRALVTSGGVPVEVVTPYVEADLRELRFEQSADVMYIAHPDYEPRKIQRTSATAFQIDVIQFNPGPTAETRVAPLSAITLTATSGFGVTVFATTPSTFLDGDVGRQIRSGAGRAVIRTVVSGTQITVDILDTFSTTGPIPAGQWTMDGSPNAGTLTPTVKAPEGAGTQLTSSVNAFREEDVGKFAYLLSGIVRITDVLSPGVVIGQIVKAMTDNLAAAAAGTWTLEAAAWSSLNGFPGVVCLHQQRLWFAGSNAFPDRIWGSVVADYENFARGVADDDSVEYQLAMSGVNLIRWMKALPEGLAIGTMAGEVTLSGGGSDAPLTPTNVQARERTFYGADFICDAIRTTNLVLFLQRGARRVREFTINQESISGEYVAPDLLLISEQLTREGIAELDRAAAPDSLIFAVTNDGTLLSCAYERPENVVGWSHHVTGDPAAPDLFESVAVIPNSCNTGDEVWVSIRRLLDQGDYFHENYFHANYWAQNPWYFQENGTVPRRYIELFDGTMNVDSGLVYAGAAAGTFTGLDHLDGQQVKAVDQDGIVYDLVVVDGSIALPNLAQASELEVGLHYTSTLKTLRPELQTPAGTAQARRKHWNHVTVRVYCTRGVLLLNEASRVEYPEGTDLDESYTGDMHRMTDFGWDREGQLTVQTTEPKPCTVLALTGGLQLDDP